MGHRAKNVEELYSKQSLASVKVRKSLVSVCFHRGQQSFNSRTHHILAAVEDRGSQLTPSVDLIELVLPGH